MVQSIEQHLYDHQEVPSFTSSSSKTIAQGHSIPYLLINPWWIGIFEVFADFLENLWMKHNTAGEMVDSWHRGWLWRFQGKMTITRIWSPKIFKTFPMFCPIKDVDLPPSWGDAPKHWPTHALDKKPSAARREKSILMFIKIVIISFKSGLLRYMYQLHNIYTVY